MLIYAYDMVAAIVRHCPLLREGQLHEIDTQFRFGGIYRDLNTTLAASVL